MMYALAINGSPRKDGNTYNLLKEVLEPIAQAGWETELIQVGGKADPRMYGLL
jgi:multimeric flavodoxin WrbA